MIEVTVFDDGQSLKTVRFQTNAVEVIDGALIVYTEGAKNFIAGFAPGQWIRFQNLDA